MIRRLFNSCLLRPEDFPRSRDDLQVLGVFNPGAVASSEGVVLLVRVAEASRERRRDYYSLPRFDPAANTIVTDWIRCEDAITRDQRLIIRKADGRARLTFISHLRVVHSHDGRTIASISEARLSPANEYEEFGLEDPRITQIGDTFWITYVAVSRHGVSTALASTPDFQTFKRHGIIFPPENKDVVIFPEKIADHYLALHRPNPRQWFAKPEMWTATSPDLVQWRDHQFFLGGTQDWEIGRVGAGTPPMRRPEGWITLYHGNSRREGDPTIGVYSGGALLLDPQNPRRIVGRIGPILVPTTEFERTGFVPDIVFPTGWVDQGETTLVYYGAADTVSAVVEFSWRDLLQSLRP